MSGKKELTYTVSDLTTSGIISEIINSISSLPPGIANVMNIALSGLACTSNLFLRLDGEKVAKKDRQKTEEFLEELHISMEKQQIGDLKFFTELDFPIEIYSVVEEIVKEGINAKGKLLRKFAANIITYIGSSDTPNLMQGKSLCLRILKELDENDIKVLILYEAIRISEFGKSQDFDGIIQASKAIKKELLIDTSIYAQTIHSSSIKLYNLGLISNICSLNPYDEGETNKVEMIENFLSLNRDNATGHYRELKKYLYTFV